MNISINESKLKELIKTALWNQLISNATDTGSGLYQHVINCNSVTIGSATLNTYGVMNITKDDNNNINVTISFIYQ